VIDYTRDCIYSDWSYAHSYLYSHMGRSKNISGIGWDKNLIARGYDIRLTYRITHVIYKSIK